MESRQMRPAEWALIAILVIFLVMFVGVLGIGTVAVVRERVIAPAGAPARPAQVTPTPRLELAGEDPFEQTLIQLYQRVRPSVVNISATKMVNVEDAPSDEGESYIDITEGSGFIYDSAGYIVTNHHVIEGALDIQVTLFSGEELPAEVVGSDLYSDLAVLKVEAPAALLPPVELGDSDQVQVGQRAIAIGNPFGFQHTVTAGFVSSVGRVIQQETGYSIPYMIQTDAAINPGNSGGPLLDSRGRVIGVNTLLYSQTGTSAGVGFAIPVNLVKRVVPALISQGYYEHAWLGVSGISLNRRVAEAADLPYTRGALVETVMPDSPAEKAGLRGGTHAVEVPGYLEPVLIGGDIITAFDGYPINSFDDLISRLENASPGQTVTLTVMRDDKPMRIKVTLGRRPGP
jgi:S1-C subfamily serine protease